MAAYNERRVMSKGNEQVILPVLKKLLEHLENRLVILREDVAGHRALLTTPPPVWEADQIVLSFERVSWYLAKTIERYEAARIEACPQSPAGMVNEFFVFAF